MTPARPRLVVIVGPTAAGKTQLALELARRVGGEIVSCDSQQVYRGMDVGTGKVTAEERAAVPHHVLDVAQPDEVMTAARFVELADAAIADIAARGKPVIVCGGTGLYVRTLLLGLFEGPGANPQRRAELAAKVAESGLPSLHRWLREVDPVIAAKIDPRDEKRVVRALEVYLETGVPMSEHQARHDHRNTPPRYPVLKVGLSPEREVLYQRIERRVDQMIASGLVAEVERLRSAGYRPPMRSQEAIGYAEIHDVLDGRLELATAVEYIKRNSRRYARRQVSWYRGDLDVRWSLQPDAVDQGELERYLMDPSRDPHVP
ncbi:MAG: tRNA (adenosine(37)-N6)-dimethylallyltransferase MiaA [Kofleriaceae bacterium]